MGTRQDTSKKNTKNLENLVIPYSQDPHDHSLGPYIHTYTYLQTLLTQLTTYSFMYVVHFSSNDSTDINIYKFFDEISNVIPDEISDEISDLNSKDGTSEDSPANRNIVKKPRSQKGESEIAREKRLQRNRFFAKEARKRSKSTQDQICREAETLRYINSMLMQSIKDVLAMTNAEECEHRHPTVLAIKQVLSVAEMRASTDVKSLGDIIKSLREKEASLSSAETTFINPEQL